MPQQIGRLAMRVEGDFWVAYYAMPDTMEGALLLGSARMAFITRDKARKVAFMGMMQEAVADLIEDAVGTRPTWNAPTSAPEHERAGRA